MNSFGELLIYCISFCLLFLAIHLCLKWRASILFNLFSSEKTLRSKSLVLREGSKSTDTFTLDERTSKTNFVLNSLTRIKNAFHPALEQKENRFFDIVVFSSFLIVICGFSVCIYLNNLFLLPLCVVLPALIPYYLARRILVYYNEKTLNELQRALSIIGTSYVRTNDIILSVSENIDYINEPVKGLFLQFISETKISPDIEKAIQNMKNKLNNPVFSDWCETLIACQSDGTFRYSLLPVVNRLTDEGIIKGELKTVISAARGEFFTLVAMTLANIPLLYILNKEWYNVLMFSLIGKMVLFFCGAIIVFTTVAFDRIITWCFASYNSLHIIRFISIIIFFTGPYLAFSAFKQIPRSIKLITDNIQSSLTGFVLFIQNSLTHSRDIVKIFEDYKKRTNRKFADELDIVIADMRSGNIENALLRFERRYNCALLSDVVRGLINTINGNDSSMYWEALNLKMSDYERGLLKKREAIIPKKVRRLSLCLVLCFVLTYATVMTISVINSISVLF